MMSEGAGALTLVTGAAGFIGSATCHALLDRGGRVIGVDDLNDYYDPALKRARLHRLQARAGFDFVQADVADREAITALVDGPAAAATGIVHLAAQAGVRYSLTNPYAYIRSNVLGQVVMLEAARRLPGLWHFVYASSSSVYGGNTELPFGTQQRVDQPVSLYAATKRADELMGHTYAHLYDLPQTGLRFFTVYGPWGRPDMAAWLFCQAILAREPIRVFNDGAMMRDFTYIDDIVAGVLAALDHPPPRRAAGGNAAPHRLYNLGNNRAEKLLDFIATIETALGVTAEKRFEPLQPGDVPATYADIAATTRDLGWRPTTPISVGLPRFVAWYRTYHGV